MKQYLILDDVEAVLRRIDDLITVQVENKWYNHFRYVLKYFWDNENENILGKTNSDSFCIWQYNYIWGGIFYPIIYATFTTNNASTILELKTKLNIFGKLLSIILFLGMMIGVIYSNITKINNDIYFNFKVLLPALIISLLIQSLPFAAYNLTRFQTIKFIEKYLALTKFSDKTKPS
jgi:hypothetical protein